MDQHLTINMPSFCVVELRNSPAITRIPRLESVHVNRNLFDPELFRDSLAKELHVFRNFAQFERLSVLAVQTGKQSGGWLRHVKQHA